MINSLKRTLLMEWIDANCPVLWSLLNIQAKKTLPRGLIEYSGGGIEIERFEHNLKPVENVLIDLEDLCGSKSLGDAYRRDFSRVNSGNQVWELFCEISVCCSLGKIADGKKLTLRPPTGKGTYSDCLLKIQGFSIYAEVKRYVDPWPPIYELGSTCHKEIPNKRSICITNEKPNDTVRPRVMDLKSKLLDLNRQFPDRGINILFVFHPSLGESQRYLTQAFFGEANFFAKHNYILNEDGLFSKEEWRIISACCFSYFNPFNSNVVFQYVWENPRAYIGLPKIVLDEFHKMRQH